MTKDITYKYLIHPNRSAIIHEQKYLPQVKIASCVNSINTSNLLFQRSIQKRKRRYGMERKSTRNSVVNHG